MVRLYVLLAIIAAILLVLLARNLARADPASLARGLRWVAALLGVGGILLVALSGRVQGLLISLGALLPLAGRAMAAWQRARAAAGPASGQRSEVRTRLLHVWLDHDTGVMTGTVLEGRFQGRTLDDLIPEQRLELLEECRASDSQSAAILEAYLDRMHGDAWRDAAGSRRQNTSAPGAANGRMTREEAYQVLGLEPGAGPDQVREAHRRLIQRLHPDRGGSSYLAARINQAKDVLLADLPD
jgi:hypothetical protein